VILNYERRNKVKIIFHLLQICLQNFTYYDIKTDSLENKPGFRSNLNLKLMDQIQEILRYHHCAYRARRVIARTIFCPVTENIRIAALALPPINAIMQSDFFECFQNKEAMVFF